MSQQPVQDDNLPLTEEQWQRQQLANIGQYLKVKRGETLAALLPQGVTVERFASIVLNAVMKNPDLLTADRASLYSACQLAAADGLMPDGREAVLNIYNTKQKVKDGRGREVTEWVPTVQYMPMVRGLLKIMRNSGEVDSIDAAAVYEHDHFRFVRGDHPNIEHQPYIGDEDPGKIIAAYAIVRLRNGEVQREVMPRRDIEKVRAASKSDGANSPWTKWYDQMAIKAVLKRIAKLLPNSNEKLELAFQNDNDATGFDFSAGRNSSEIDAISPGQNSAENAPISAAPALPDDRAGQQKRSRFASIIAAKQQQPAAAAPASTDEDDDAFYRRMESEGATV
ncbi:recombinase RecT [Caballeronia zhejiangensis]|uniref:Rect protein n=1 Tax=Caballeronia zhejiangensis TaxID=871203 RepID=A0A656QEE1_9BURK|nr:recombinase RecT [Caballeronia zhejiangensis]KDR25931.1 rect protein [Caballeronia zhejiangensis]